MNPITFNEPFEALCRAPNSDPDAKAILLNALKSPLVLWEGLKGGTTQEALDAADGGNGFPRMPFSSFRADITINQKDGTKLRTRMVIWSGEGRIVAFTRIISCASPQPGTMMVMEDLMEKDLIIGAVVNGTADNRIRMIYKKSGLQAPDYPLELQGVFHAITFGSLALLAVDFANPHFHLCRKSPPEGGVSRSVEWRKAREHYVLIHKSHPANQKEAAGKRVIEAGALHRAAHSRRAHYRMLRSPRFKNKVGQRVWVASAWVGPKEWTDRSGQIYRIVDR